MGNQRFHGRICKNKILQYYIQSEMDAFFSNKKARLVKFLGFIIAFIIFLKTN